MTMETQFIEVAEEKAVAPKVMRPMLTKQSITAITYDLKMAEVLVTEALEEQIDYGQIPGIPGKGLWDPGAAKIMNAFQCYPRHKVLYHEENVQLITWAIEAEIIHRENQQIVGAGVGACSTREPKYKYRWVEIAEVKRLGYSEPEIENMKKKKAKRWTEDNKVYEVDEYRVENPEYGEQVNTIFQMAAKRAETDAAKTLPGVASALRKLFETERTKKSGKRKNEDIDEDSPRWTTFWNAARDLLGDDYQTKVHQMLGVQSVQDWLKSGKSLDDAIKMITKKLSENIKPNPDNLTESDIKTTNDLINMMKSCYGWPEERVWAEANYKNRKNFEDARVESPWAIFARLRDFVRSQEKTHE